MAITLYDAIPSSNSDRVKILLHEKGLSYERVTLDLNKMEHTRPEFLKLNPYGKVPVIDDDGKVLFESCIINEYLDEKYPNPPFMPKDPYLRGRVRILTDYGINHLQEAYTPLRLEMLKKDAERDRKVIEASLKTIFGDLRYLENEIGDKPYLLGDISLVDVNIVTRFVRLHQWSFFPTPSLPRLSGWLNRMIARPSVKPLV
jgi:glutathione S-transferase